jgi:hypothetical protein
MKSGVQAAEAGSGEAGIYEEYQKYPVLSTTLDQSSKVEHTIAANKETMDYVEDDEPVVGDISTKTRIGSARFGHSLTFDEASSKHVQTSTSPTAQETEDSGAFRIGRFVFRGKTDELPQ